MSAAVWQRPAAAASSGSKQRRLLATAAATSCSQQLQPAAAASTHVVLFAGALVDRPLALDIEVLGVCRAWLRPCVSGWLGEGGFHAAVRQLRAAAADRRSGVCYAGGRLTYKEQRGARNIQWGIAARCGAGREGGHAGGVRRDRLGARAPCGGRDLGCGEALLRRDVADGQGGARPVCWRRPRKRLAANALCPPAGGGTLSWAGCFRLAPPLPEGWRRSQAARAARRIHSSFAPSRSAPSIQTPWPTPRWLPATASSW